LEKLLSKRKVGVIMAEFIEKVDQNKFVSIMQEWEYNPFSEKALIKIYEIETDSEINSEKDFIEIDKVVLSLSYNEYKNWEEFYDEYSNYCINYEITNVNELAKNEIVFELDENAFLLIPF